MTRRLLMLVGATVLMAAVLAASQQVPARDTPTPAAPQKGSAELTVWVSTDESSSQPLRRASVAIQAGELDVPHIGVTGDDGRVVFRNLVAGNYLLTASRSGYVRTFHGSALPGRGPGVAVTVLDGQRAPDVRIRMLRGGVLTGVIRTASGRPAPGQQVQAIMVRSAAGEKRGINLETSLGTASTDDRGVYRIFGLAPGDYIVSVPAIGLVSQDMRPITAAELAWADQVVAAAAVRATSATPGAAPDAAPTVVYAPADHPGTTVAAEAGVIPLRPSEERAGVDFSLQLVPTAQVRGRVVDADGRPQGGLQVTTLPTRPSGLDLFSSLLNASSRTLADGTFTLQGVKPGTYSLSVRGAPLAVRELSTPDADVARRQGGPAGRGNAPGPPTHWATEEISVQGQDLTDITLTLRPGMNVTGTVVYEAATRAAPADLSRNPLSLLPAPTGTGLNDLASAITSITGAGGSTIAKIEADGKFAIGGVAPGRYRLTTPFGLIPSPMMNMMTGGWTLKSVLANGRDIADAPVEIKAGANLTGVVVTFTDQPSELSGTVIDAAGRVTPNFPIIVFATDRAYWTLGSRRVQQARPATDGRFKVTGLPAGEYFVCAVTAVDRTEVYDPAFLELLVPGSFKITIADGEKKTQDLRLAGGNF